MDSILEDLRQGWRSLHQSPMATSVAFLTLAVGIGASTTLFNLVRQWIFNAVSFKEPHRLVVLWTKDTKAGWTSSVSGADFLDWRERSRSFEHLSAWTTPEFNLAGTERPERIQGAQVTSDFFSMLGVRPVLGRDFLAEEERPGNDRVAILSHGLWLDHFSADSGAIGRTIRLDSQEYTVIGVMPEELHLTLMGRANVWIPLAITDQQRANRAGSFCNVLGRLKNGTALARAQSELDNIAAGLEREHPETNAASGVLLNSLAHEIGKHVGNQALYTGFCCGIAILLISCANVAGILLARALNRRKEMAVRLALGAGRGRLVRQLLTENLVVFLPAAALGALLAHWEGNWITHAIPYENRGYLPNYGRVYLDWATLGFISAAAVLSAVVCGLSPALEASKVALIGTLKDAAGSVTASVGAHRTRKALVVCEVMLALVCIVPAGLVGKSLLRRLAADPGFHAPDVLTAVAEVPRTTYPDAAGAGEFYSRLLERIQNLPGVTSAALSRFIPFGHNYNAREFYVEGRPIPPAGAAPGTRITAATPGYAATLGMRLIRGRFISEQDGAATQPVIVINETLARRTFPNQNPIGQRLRLGNSPGATWRTIVGVVGDMKLFTLADRSERQSYVPFTQSPSRDVSIVLRTAGAPEALEAPLRAAVLAFDPDLPLSGVEPLAQRVSDQEAPHRIFAQFASFNGLLALFLAAVGIYGVMAYVVAGRTREFGIRLALGARPADVLRLVGSYGGRLLMVGTLAGAGAAYAVSRLLAGALFGVSAFEPYIYIGSIAVLAVATLLATLVPARRAMRVDPMVALRYE